MDAKTMLTLMSQAKREALEQIPNLDAMSVERGTIAMFGLLTKRQPIEQLKDLLEVYNKQYGDGVKALKDDLKELPA